MITASGDSQLGIRGRCAMHKRMCHGPATELAGFPGAAGANQACPHCAIVPSSITQSQGWGPACVGVTVLTSITPTLHTVREDLIHKMKGNRI